MKKSGTGTRPLTPEEAERIIRRQTKDGPGPREAEQIRAAAVKAAGEAVAIMIEAMGDPGIGGRLIAMANAAARAARTSPDPAASRTRAVLRSLQFFEHAIGTPRGILHPPRRYLDAAEKLIGGGIRDDDEDGGDPDGGAILQGFAVQLFRIPGREHDPSLTVNCRERWRERHALREMFPYEHPDERAGQEEQILARLLHYPDDPGLRGLVTDYTFTDDLRAEVWHAAVGGDPASVRDRFAAAMLRAPGWALPGTGWPGHDRAHRLLERLLRAPVTADQARHAAETVAAMQEQAENDCGIVITPDSDLSLLARRPNRVKEAGIDLKKPPPPGETVRFSIRVTDPDAARAFGRGVLPPPFPLFGDPPRPRPPRDTPSHGPRPGQTQDLSPERVSVPLHRQAPEPRALVAPPPPLPAPGGPAPRH